MSDNWISLIPEDPRYIPSEQQRERAIILFRELAPDAEEIVIRFSDNIQFFDCGANFERITCPSCRMDIPIDWWRDHMDMDFDITGFKLQPYLTPCCNSSHTLHELVYDWQQGFGRFAIDAMNANIGALNVDEVEAFEQLLATRLRVIYQHI